MKPRNVELRALTGARGIAAWLVVMFHIRLSIAHAPAPLAHLFAKGYLSVDFFFLLSGFVIWLSWGERMQREGWAAVGPFLRKRIARIWPLHLLTLAATVALAVLFVATGRADPEAFPFAELPLNVVLVQNWGLTDRLAWNVPSWSISAEWGAYLIFPVVAMTIDWRRLSRLALLALAGTLILGLCLIVSASSTLSFDIPRFGLLRCVVEFMTGTLVCALWQRGGGARIALGGAVVAAAAWWSGLPEIIAAPVLFASLLFVLAGAGPRHLLARRIPHRLGEISYATYLCHYPLWIAFKLVFVRDVDDVPVPLILLYLAIVLVGSGLVYDRFERPAQRWVEARLHRTPRAARATS